MINEAPSYPGEHGPLVLFRTASRAMSWVGVFAEVGSMPFVDRTDAGHCLARRLELLRGHDVVVLGLACRIARMRGAWMEFVAVPVASPEAIARVRGEADEVVCLETPERLTAVGHWYADFRQTTDDEVAVLLATAGS